MHSVQQSIFTQSTSSTQGTPLAPHKESQDRPGDVSQEKWDEWTKETTTKVNDPQSPYFMLLGTLDIKRKAIEIGIASCWLRERWRAVGMTEQQIWDKQHSWGRKVMFTPKPIWRQAKRASALIKNL